MPSSFKSNTQEPCAWPEWCMLFKIRGSQPRVILFSRGHLVALLPLDGTGDTLGVTPGKEGRMLLACSGWRPRMLLSAPQRTGQPLTVSQCQWCCGPREPPLEAGISAKEIEIPKVNFLLSSPKNILTGKTKAN